MRKLFASQLVLILSLGLIPSTHGIDATPASAPFYPTTVSAVLTNPSDSSTTTVTVSWSGQSANGSPITGFQAYAYSGSGWTTQASVSCSAAGTDSSCNISGLAFATTYRFKVIVTNSVGSATSDLSALPGVTTPSRTQTVSITGAPTSYTFGSADFQLNASATSGLAVTWSVPSTTSICQVDLSGSVHFLAAGACVVRATQDGSGSAYASAYDEETITATATLSATIASATSIQSVQATLNGLVPFSGVETTPTFCVSRTNNVTSSCSLPSGVTISSYSPALITLTSGNTVSAVVSGLNQNTTYYFWLTVSATGATPFSTTTSSFTTTVGPSLAFSGTTTGIVGTAMTGTLTATSGSGVYSTWSATSYPPGLNFEPGVTASTSLISGVPSTAGTYAALFTVTDSSGIEAQVTISYSIAAAPTTPSTDSSPGGDGAGGGTVVTIPENEPETVKIPKKAAIEPDLTSVDDGVISTEFKVGGKQQVFEINPNQAGDGLTISTGLGGFNIEVESDSPLYKSQSISEPRVAIKSGSKAVVRGDNFKPDSQIDFYFFSKATWAGGSFADSNGRFTGSATAFKSLPLGFHTLQLVGISPDNKPIVINMPVIILPPDGKVENISDVIISKTITKPIRTSIFVKDIPKNSLISWPKGSAPSLKGIQSIKLGKRLIQITPQSGYSGIALFSVTIKTKNLSLERMVSLKVLPLAASSASFAPINSTQTRFSWKKAPGAISYKVLRNGQVLCENRSLSCTVKTLYGPSNNISLISVGNDGTESKPLKIKYLNPKFILVSMVNFEDNSSELNPDAILKLTNFMKLAQQEGFQSIQVFGYADASGSSNRNQVLSSARAKAVTSFITGQVAGFVESLGQGISRPIKSNATKEGRAANRRVEIYVS